MAACDSGPRLIICLNSSRPTAACAFGNQPVKKRTPKASKVFCFSRSAFGELGWQITMSDNELGTHRWRQNLSWGSAKSWSPLRRSTPDIGDFTSLANAARILALS